MEHADYFLLIECDGISHLCTMHEFERANADDPDLIEDAKCLAKGFGFDVGGGASHVFHVSRWN